MNQKERRILIVISAVLGMLIVAYVGFVYWQKSKHTDYLTAGKARKWKEAETNYKEEDDYDEFSIDDYEYTNKKDLESMADAAYDTDNSEEDTAEEDTSDDGDIDEDATDEDESETKASQDSEYVIPDSDTRKLTKADLKSLSMDQLSKARNEIYARHGRRFADKSLQQYFNSKNWYKPKYSPKKFDKKTKKLLSSLERRNALFIRKYEEKRK